MFEIRKNLDLRKILEVTNIFLKSRFVCRTKTEAATDLGSASSILNIESLNELNFPIDRVLLSSAETGPSKLTVGKIFGGMLILENWKLTKFSAMPPRKKHLPVSDGT